VIKIGFEFERADVAMEELRALVWQETVKSHPELHANKVVSYTAGRKADSS
jgi:hypothetical protein